MSSINDWQQLASTWQAQSVDLPTLRRRTFWHTLRLYGVLALELLVVLLVWAMAAYWQWIKPLPLLWQVWAWLWAVLTPLLTWTNIRARTGSWRAREESVLGLLELKKARALATLRVMEIGNRVLPYAVAMGWLWNGLSIWLYPPVELGVVSFSGALSVTAILSLWFWLCYRRARKERRIVAETERLLQDLA